MASLFQDGKSYINGEWVPAASGKTFEVKNPANGNVIATVPDMSSADANAAIDSAKKVSNHKLGYIFLVIGIASIVWILVGDSLDQLDLERRGIPEEVGYCH